VQAGPLNDESVIVEWRLDRRGIWRKEMLQEFSYALAFVFIVFAAIPTQAQKSSSPGDEFLGSWENVLPGHPGYSLSRHGDTFILMDRKGGSAEGKFNNGQLLFDRPRGQLEITYSKPSDGIDIGGQVYRRVK
jgi:hypothetical protein